jgi:SAM-dependent methyltransferase
LLWRPLAEVARREGRTIRVLDVATGGGDIPLALARLARRRGIALQLAGCDISPRAMSFARRRAEQAGAAIEFFAHDALAGPLPGGYDAVICTLFLHHLSDAEAGELLRRMAAAAGRLVVVCDLVRSRSAWLLTRGLTRLLVRSSVVHVDGPLSIRAAFTVAEARLLAEQAGLTDCEIRRNWPFRFVLSQWRDGK